MNNYKILKHKPSSKTIIRFFLLLGIFISYFLFLSWKYGFATGGIVSGLTWSFFVLCTPVADAGFLLAFPVRIVMGIRMIITIVITYIMAITLNFWAINYYPIYYEKTAVTNLLYQILTTPFPYWSIIVLCALGTFLSIWFGDEVIDAVGNKKTKIKPRKHKKIYMIGTVILFLAIIAVYYHLLASLGIDLNVLE